MDETSGSSFLEWVVMVLVIFSATLFLFELLATKSDKNNISVDSGQYFKNKFMGS